MDVPRGTWVKRHKSKLAKGHESDTSYQILPLHGVYPELGRRVQGQNDR